MRKTLITALVAATLAFTPSALAAAATSTQTSGTAAGWCQHRQSSGKYYYKHRTHWDCVVPGAYCSKAQRRAYGYSMRAAAHTKRYRCVRYSSNTWHWKPVGSR